MERILMLGLILILSGCGFRDKTTIELSCIEGKVYVDVYNAIFVNIDTDIKQPRYIVRDKSLYLNDDNTPMPCVSK